MESLYWVILYAVYRRSLATLNLASESDKARSLRLLDEEFSKSLSAQDVETLVDRRRAVFKLDPWGGDECNGIRTLLRHPDKKDPRRTLWMLVATV